MTRTAETETKLGSVPRALKAFFWGKGWFDRAAIVRHFSLCIATAGVFAFRYELQTTNNVLWMISGAVLLNWLTLLSAGIPRLAPVGRFLSPLFGMAGWIGLAHFTGGIQSVFIAGLGLEILLAARTFGTTGCAWVTAGSVAMLWGSQLISGVVGALWTPSTILIGMGVVTWFLTRHWTSERNALQLQSEQLRQELVSLRDELQQLRETGPTDGRHDRLTHGLKNTVHSLRGFTNLLEEKLSAHDTGAAALDGLRNAIGQVEALAAATKSATPPEADASQPTSAEEIQSTVEEALDDARVIDPEINWSQRQPVWAALDAPAHVLREVLVELLRNASRALEGRGKVTVCTSKEGLLYRLEVADDGCGISASMRELVFKPGFTTKQNSKGLGLFLAQRLVESHGGALYVDASEGSGARFVVDLPLAEGLPLISIEGSR